MDRVIFDAVPSYEDERDYTYKQRKISLREAVDLRQWDSPVDSQLSMGSCVGNAIANAYELTVKRLYPEQFVELSRLFIYYNSRLFDNSIKEDVGTYIRDGLKASARYGICTEKLWPYIEPNLGAQPTAECYVDATRRLITRYETLYTLRDMLEILSNNMPIVAGMAVYSEFMDLSPENPIVPMPRSFSEPLGNHAVAIIGYDLSKQLFLAKNSFGVSWGMQGYFWIPFEYVRTQVFEKWWFDIGSQTTIG